MKLREDLVAMGLFEVTTYSFVSEQDLTRTQVDPKNVLAIENPMSHEQAYLRNSLLSSHLQTAARNANYSEKLYGYFELARVYAKSRTSATTAEESWHLAVTVIGENGLLRVKNVLDMLSERYQLNATYSRSENAMYILGRQAILESNRLPSIRGEYGQIRPAVLQQFSITNELSYGEVVLDEGMFVEPPQKAAALLPYQLVNRDITIEVDAIVLWQDLQAVISQQDSVVKTQFVSEFTNAELLAAQRKKITVRVWLDCGAQPAQEEITRTVEKIEKAILAQKQFGLVKIG
jgi:phenylalanyl-tRNA synthetase beta subunit